MGKCRYSFLGCMTVYFRVEVLWFPSFFLFGLLGVLGSGVLSLFLRISFKSYLELGSKTESCHLTDNLII